MPETSNKPRRTATERLEALEAKKAALDRQAARLRARLTSEERTALTREKVIVGGAVLAALGAGKIGREQIARLIDGTILNTPTRQFLRGRGWEIGNEDPQAEESGQEALPAI